MGTKEKTKTKKRKKYVGTVSRKTLMPGTAQRKLDPFRRGETSAGIKVEMQIMKRTTKSSKSFSFDNAQASLEEST